MPDLQPVFEELRRRLSLHEDVFRRSANVTDANTSASRKAVDPAPDTTYLLLGAASEKYPGGLAFAGVQLGKRYVSYHLMCVYLSPDLHESMAPELRRRMHGKSCFNFTKVDELLFDELAAITAKGRDLYAAQGWLASSPRESGEGQCEGLWVP